MPDPSPSGYLGGPVPASGCVPGDGGDHCLHVWAAPPSALDPAVVRAMTAAGLRSDQIAKLCNVPLSHVAETAFLHAIPLQSSHWRAFGALPGRNRTRPRGAA